MKKIMVILAVLILSGCAHYQECMQIKQMFFRDQNCPSGFASLGITGHGPICTDQHTGAGIEQICGSYY